MFFRIAHGSVSGRLLTGSLLKLLTLTAAALVFLCSGYLGINRAQAAGIDVEFEKTFGSENDDRGLSACPVDDGGYIIVGETVSGYQHGSGGRDVYLIKIDKSGLLQWKRSCGGIRDDYGVHIRQTKDGGYIIAGITESYSDYGSTNKDVYLVKTNTSGWKQWHKTYGNSGDDYGSCVQQTGDGGYIIAGKTTASKTGDTDVYLIKTSSSGRLEWEKTFGGHKADLANYVEQTNDGGYIVVGQTYSFGAGNFDGYMIKTNARGEKEWEKTFGGRGWDALHSVTQTKDGGYILTGETSTGSPGGSSAWLIKTDSKGSKLWEKTFNGKGWAVGRTVRQTDDRGCMAAGWTVSKDSGGFNFYLIKTDPNGKKIWEKTLKGTRFDRQFSIQQAGDGGYIVTGWWADLLKWNKTRSSGTEVYIMKIQQVP
ncbi:hypothetical protein JOC37_000862 [Desulfohalotomaculum tongense]|uniref:hypothetical protein n=1 Tax=Desulforadius tongensis TaxID=1216062 RepID=UPI0019571D70|nr:hypothetical protein [Desulforadius tongensis]MBM7854489.1 hypothetical protein [Desulforadius tongensis]